MHHGGGGGGGSRTGQTPAAARAWTAPPVAARRLAALSALLTVVAVVTLLTADARADEPSAAVVPVGAGAYVTTLPPGAKGPPAAVYRVPALRDRPMPTNDWWSSLAWVKLSERQYPHPLAVAAEAGGLRVYAPAKITANKDAIFGFMPAPSADDLVLGLAGAPPFDEAKVESFSNWFVTARFSAAGDGEGRGGMSVTYGHGSPFVYVTFDGDGADPTITFAKPPQVWAGSADVPALGVAVDGKAYGLFAPSGSRWEGLGSKSLVCRTNGKRYFSLALLPDASPKTLANFAGVAQTHVTGTKVEWSYDAANALVVTRYAFTLKAYEGAATDTFYALYPHQWRSLNPPLDTGLVAGTYPSVRGPMKLFRGESFETMMTFHGVLPSLPLSPDADRAKLAAYVKAEATAIDKSDAVRDTYAEGKWLGRPATVIPIAEELGLTAEATALRDRLRSRLELWLNPREGSAGVRKQGLFYYDRNWGTLIGYPASFGSDRELNDHHFHYGYFLKAAAEIARHDPAWAADGRWGGMVRLIARDIASADRDDPLFPFLRNFDPYAGHSWASGHARFGDGNNNESSSEAMNAWCGLILLGEATHDTRLRDLGIYLYTTEMNAIQEYWFDVRGDNRPPGYTPSVVTMVWGGKGSNGTWFSNHPAVVHGINFLPIHGGSLYLGLYPDYARRNYAALVKENGAGGDTFAEWPDVLWMYRALIDPHDALRLYDAAGDAYHGEAGNSRANTYHWITSLAAFGMPDPTVTADHPLYAVFKKGDVRTHAAWNIGPGPQTVRFSDGFELRADKPGLATGRR